MQLVVNALLTEQNKNIYTFEVLEKINESQWPNVTSIMAQSWFQLQLRWFYI